MSSAHELGTVMAELATPAGAEPEEVTPSIGSAAIESKAENHTANRVLEFRRPTRRRRTQANSPMAMPSSMQFSMLSADIRARWFRLSAVVIYDSVHQVEIVPGVAGAD